MLLLCWANIANIGAFTTQTQAGFQSLPLGGPRSSSEGSTGVQPPGVRRFALGTELGICEFSAPSTSRQGSHIPLLHKLAQANRAPSAWGEGQPRASDD